MIDRQSNIWALVLAAGEGSRLRALTTTESGIAVPKQFCSLAGGASLVQLAVQRAAAIAPVARVVSVVARQHRNWWGPQLQGLAPRNLVVQPENRGTAHGILLPLLRIAARDPDAVVVLLPSDHYVREEAVLARSLRDAAAMAVAHRTDVFLLGISPESPDPELGYIVPLCDGVGRARRVGRFVEKPSVDAARRLLDQGALWNVFIAAGTAHAFLEMFERQMPGSLDAMRDTADAEQRLSGLYVRLRNADFSRDVLEAESARLRVLATAECGWTDLGTPERVADTLRRGVVRSASDAMPEAPGSLNLSLQQQRRQRWAGSDLCGVA